MTVANEQTRIEWVKRQLLSLPDGSTLLDVGAGECQYKKFCSHLNYVSQDVSQYDGKGDQSGLQTGTWDFSQIDVICDLLDMPEENPYDSVLCTEVLEHVPDPIRALEKLVSLTKSGGKLVITAPFSSLTHFAPYHYATGFSSFFYSYHLENMGCDIVELSPNGGYFDYIAQEVHRAPHVYKKFTGSSLGFFRKQILKQAKKILENASYKDASLAKRKTSELLTFGWHVVATKR